MGTRKDLIGRTIVNVVTESYKQSEGLFDSVALYLDDGSVVVFRSIPEPVSEVATYADERLRYQNHRTP